MALGALSDESKVTMLQERFAGAPFTVLEMGLSTLNVTPDHATTLAALVAAELTETGYARQAVTGWTFPVLDASFHAYSEADQVDFTQTSGSDTPTIYTWFWRDTMNNALVRSGRFAIPFVIPSGSTVSFIPFEQLTGEV